MPEKFLFSAVLTGCMCALFSIIKYETVRYLYTNLHTTSVLLYWRFEKIIFMLLNNTGYCCYDMRRPEHNKMINNIIIRVVHKEINNLYYFHRLCLLRTGSNEAIRLHIRHKAMNSKFIHSIRVSARTRHHQKRRILQQSISCRRRHCGNVFK